MEKTQETRGTSERGFTLLEILIVLFFFPFLVSVLIAIAKTTIIAVLTAEEQDASPVFALYEDIRYNYLLAKNIATGSNLIELTRLDDCVITYFYDPNLQLVDKSVTCPSQPAVSDKSVRVWNVISFTVSAQTGYFCYTIQRTQDFEPYSFCVGGMQ